MESGMTTITFFNNKGGVGKTSLVYHLAWMFAEMGQRVLVADFDPQANLTAMFLRMDEIEEIWEHDQRHTLHDALRPVFRGVGDIKAGGWAAIDKTSKLRLLVGDLELSIFEDSLSQEWPNCLASGDQQESAVRRTTAFGRLLTREAESFDADISLIDIGPNLGALNRVALLATDYVIVPVTPDLFSLQGLRNVGQRLAVWRSEWNERRKKFPKFDFTIPRGQMEPIGYIASRHSIKESEPVQAYARWLSRFPKEYRAAMGIPLQNVPNDIDKDSLCFARLKDYRSLMAMAQEARKPMFMLRSADGAIGGHYDAVRRCYEDFRKLADKIMIKIQREHAGRDNVLVP
jgi:chromosome partitioning protein